MKAFCLADDDEIRNIAALFVLRYGGIDDKRIAGNKQGGFDLYRRRSRIMVSISSTVTGLAGFLCFSMPKSALADCWSAVISTFPSSSGVNSMVSETPIFGVFGPDLYP